MRSVTFALLGAVAGVTTLSLFATPASAFTLSSLSLAQPVTQNYVEPVWWDRWSRWHPDYYGPHDFWRFRAEFGDRWRDRSEWEGRRCWGGQYGRAHCAD